MTVTISYSQVNIAGGALDTFATSSDPSLATLSNGNWVGISSYNNGAGIAGVAHTLGASNGSTIFNGATSAGGNFSSTTTGTQQNAEIAGLAGGGYVGVFEDYSSGTAVVRGRIHNAAGAALADDFVISSVNGQAAAQVNPDVATLSNGNFVVVWQGNFGATDRDIYSALYSPTGTLISQQAVDSSSAYNSSVPKVAALANGGYAVVYTNLATNGDTQVWTAVYSNAGVVVAAPQILASTGTINRNPAIAATPDGGYVVVLEDNEIGSPTAGTDINLIKVNSLGGVINFVNASIGDAPTGDQLKPAVTVLGNGFILVSWEMANATFVSTVASHMFDADLNDTNYRLTPSGFRRDVATTSLGDHSFVQASANLADNSVSYFAAELIRNSIGDSANDLILGDSWRDQISGGAGNDFIVGGAGADTIDGGSGFDSVSWLGLQAGTLIDLTNQATNAFAAAGDTVSNFEAYYLTAFGDSFTNNNSGGYMYGFAGNDIIVGGTGTDFIDGGVGGDQISAGAGFDYVSYSNAAAGVTVNMITPGANSGEAAGDVITGVEAFYLSAHNDTFIGQSGQNFVFAGNGVDVLYGGVGSSDWLFGEAGNDFLAGGDFDDLLSGGAGNDTYAFNSWVGNGFDSILNFTSGGDKIQLGAAGFGLTAGQSFTAGSTFVAAASPFATTAAGTLLYATGLGILYYDPDGSGAIGAIALAQFSGAPSIAASDFYVV